MGWLCWARVCKVLESLCSVREQAGVGLDHRVTKQ